MLRTRLISAAVAIPFLAWTIFLGPLWFFNLVVLFFTFVALREFAAMALICGALFVVLVLPALGRRRR